MYFKRSEVVKNLLDDSKKKIEFLTQENQEKEKSAESLRKQILLMEEKRKSDIENLTEELKTTRFNNIKVRVNGMLLFWFGRVFHKFLKSNQSL